MIYLKITAMKHLRITAYPDGCSCINVDFRDRAERI
jgi:hypothetical protein